MNCTPSVARTPDWPHQPLEEEITTLWGHINAATFRFLKLVAEYGACEGWGWHGTASHIERLVRQYRKFERLEDAWLANEAHRQRYLRYRYDDDGSVIIEARLPAEIGAMLKTALEGAEAVLYQAGREDSQDPDADTATLHNGVAAETAGDKPPSYPTVAPEVLENEAENTAGARRADALALLAERFLAHENDNCGSTDRFLVTVHIDRSELAGNADRTTGPGPRTPVRGPGPSSDGPALAAATAKRLGCDAPLVGIVGDDDGNPLNIGRRTRAIPHAMKRALAARDGGCRFPGCNRTRFTEGHHIRHWADGGETRLDNLVTLCRFHHRLLHEGGFGLRVTDDGLYVFSRPDGSRIAETGCCRGNTPTEAQLEIDLPARNEKRGLEIDHDTIRPCWTGEKMDSSVVIDALLRVRERPYPFPDRKRATEAATASIYS